MMWKKQGLIFRSSGQHPWMQTHTAVPIPLRLSGDLYRIYFGTRDSQQHPRIGYIELDLKEPTNILKVSDNYVLGEGPRGYFDDNGVYPGPIIKDGQNLLMYYVGRNNGTPPLFYMSIGLAVSEDRGKTFRKLFKAPIMARSEFDPWMVSMPCVRREEGRWRMWYISGFKWDEAAESPHSYYHIKYAESADGIEWERDGWVAIELREGETNIAGPSVLKEDGLYKMWYSYVASQGYRIGYAESFDGYIWERKDADVGIDVSPTGWDSQTMAYPYVFIHDGRKFMLYSGNGYGREGFGLAVAQESSGST